ncbi:MAG: CDP-alcohol phosphatidyltransferase family protein [Candidatus Omnitrophota bacterium]
MVKLNLPNGLSMTRLLMVPCFFLFTYYWLKGENWMLWPARAILLLIVASDFFDGYLARVRGEVTQLGGILDPLADKLFVTASFVLLAVFDKIHDWLAITVVTKDILVSIGWCVFAVLFDKVDVEPSNLGKTATALQFFTVFAVVILPSSFPIVVLEYLTAAGTIMALVHYAYLASRNPSLR